MTTRPIDRGETIADCLGPARAAAERRFGDAPVRAWQPSRTLPSWSVWAAIGTALGAAALLTLRPLPPAEPAVVLAVAAARPSAPGAVATRPGAPAPGTAPDVPGSAADPAPEALRSGAPAPVQATLDAAPASPESLDAWALDPTSISAPHRPAARTARFNLPWAAPGVAATDEADEDGTDGGGWEASEVAITGNAAD